MPSDHSSSQLPSPRFSLRTLLLAVTAAGVFCGLSWWLTPSAMLAGSLLALLLAAHVFGNALGTQLRSGAPRRDRFTLFPGPEQPEPAAPPTSLGERSSLGWGMFLAAGVGALLGMVGGCCWIERAYHLGFDVYGLAVSSLAFGTLGALASFGIATFSQVLATAFWQAMRQK